MNMFIELWRLRQRHSSWKDRLRSWAKRFMSLPEIFRNQFRVQKFRRNGAQIGTFVMLGESIINGDAKSLRIGSGSSMGKCLIEIHDDVCIGRNVSINDNVMILTASHDLRDPNWRTKTGPISIGDFAWVASGAIVLPGVRIGCGAVVAAGAVVRIDVPDFSLAVGNPARISSERRCRNLDYQPVRLKAAISAWLGPENCDI